MICFNWQKLTTLTNFRLFHSRKLEKVMLKIDTSPTGSSACSGVSRRDFLRVGGLGLGGLALPDLFAAQSLAARSKVNFVKDKAVVLLYLSGGASHIETFNPNMDAPSPFNSVTGEVKTSLPGVSFGGTFPELAKWAHKIVDALTVPFRKLRRVRKAAAAAH